MVILSILCILSKKYRQHGVGLDSSRPGRDSFPETLRETDP